MVDDCTSWWISHRYLLVLKYSPSEVCSIQGHVFHCPSSCWQTTGGYRVSPPPHTNQRSERSILPLPSQVREQLHSEPEPGAQVSVSITDSAHTYTRAHINSLITSSSKWSHILEVQVRGLQSDVSIATQTCNLPLGCILGQWALKFLSPPSPVTHVLISCSALWKKSLTVRNRHSRDNSHVVNEVTR